MVLGVNDLANVLDELYDARARWYDIGLRLNVPAETLEKIKTPDDSSCLRQVLIIWLRSGKATWTDLCQALRHRIIDQGKLADSLLAKYVHHTAREIAQSTESQSTDPSKAIKRHERPSTSDTPAPSAAKKPKQAADKLPDSFAKDDFIRAPPADRLCVKCDRVPLNPQRSVCCQRLYCEPCSKKNKRCRTHKADLEYTSDKELYGKIQKLKIKCPNRAGGCDWSGLVLNLKNHLPACDKRPLLNPSAGASLSFTSTTAPTLRPIRQFASHYSQPQPVPGQTLAQPVITSSQSTSIGQQQTTVASFPSYRGKSEDEVKPRARSSDVLSPTAASLFYPRPMQWYSSRQYPFEFKPAAQAMGIASDKPVSYAAPTIYNPFSVSSMTLQANEIRGVDMVTSTTVVITDKRESFTWKGYGLKLHILDKCLPMGITQCKITIMVSIAGQYDFPENCHPVSAIFWLRCEPLCIFVKPVTIEMDHCAKRENTSKLCFVKAYCSQMDLPYTFKKLKEGVFNQHTSYGVVELHSFSGVSVVQEDSAEIEREYCGMLFYIGKTVFSHNFHIHFVVTWDTQAHLSVVNKEYQKKQAQAGHSQPIEFESEQIELDIPITGVTSGGLTIDPLYSPVIIKKKVDNFQPGKMIPKCELNVSFTWSEPPLRYCVKLLGAKKPYNMFNIIPSTTTTISTEIREPAITNNEKPKLKDLLTELLTKVASNWENIGIMLDIEEGQLNSIKADQGSNSSSCLREMLRIWLTQVEPSAPTWLAMAKAIERAGDPGLARDLKAKYCRTNAQ